MTRAVSRAGSGALWLRTVLTVTTTWILLAGLPSRTERVGFRLMHAIIGGKGPGSVQHRPASTMSRRPVSDTSAEARAERAVGVLTAPR